jgi:hypothetical protein
MGKSWRYALTEYIITLHLRSEGCDLCSTAGCGLSTVVIITNEIMNLFLHLRMGALPHHSPLRLFRCHVPGRTARE